MPKPSACNSILAWDLDPTNVAQKNKLREKELIIAARCSQLGQQTYTLALAFEAGIGCHDTAYPNNPKLVDLNGLARIKKDVVLNHLAVFMTSFKGIKSVMVTGLAKSVFGWDSCADFVLLSEANLKPTKSEDVTNAHAALIYQKESVFADHAVLMSKCELEK